MKSIATTYTPYLARVSAILAGVIALCALLYGVFLLEAVANTAKRTAFERQTREVVSRVSSLEGQYLAHTRALTPALAREMGFVPPVHTTTIFATAPSRSLSASAGVGAESQVSR